MDEDMLVSEVRDREIEFRLERYARARLSPDPQAIARSRARIMREARLQFEAAQLAAPMAPSVVLAPRRPLTRHIATPLLAAGMWAVLTVGSVFAAQPGGPLYPTRMWVENATLPADGASRVSAEIIRLEARLREAGEAAARGDEGAVQAAVDAYRQIADETLSATTGDESFAAIIVSVLDKHRVVLTAVAATLSERGNATAAASVEASIQGTIVHNQAVIDRLDEGSVGGGGSTGGGATEPGATQGGTGGGATEPRANQGGTGGNNSGPGGHNGGAVGAPPVTPAPTAATGGQGGGKPSKEPKPTPQPTPDPSHPDHASRGQDR